MIDFSNMTPEELEQAQLKLNAAKEASEKANSDTIDRALDIKVRLASADDKYLANNETIVRKADAIRTDREINREIVEGVRYQFRTAMHNNRSSSPQLVIGSG